MFASYRTSFVAISNPQETIPVGELTLPTDKSACCHAPHYIPEPRIEYQSSSTAFAGASPLREHRVLNAKKKKINGRYGHNWTDRSPFAVKRLQNKIFFPPSFRVILFLSCKYLLLGLLQVTKICIIPSLLGCLTSSLLGTGCEASKYHVQCIVGGRLWWPRTFFFYTIFFKHDIWLALSATLSPRPPNSVPSFTVEPNRCRLIAVYFRVFTPGAVGYTTSFSTTWLFSTIVDSVFSLINILYIRTAVNHLKMATSLR